jgi:hypothetical protein
VELPLIAARSIKHAEIAKMKAPITERLFSLRLAMKELKNESCL